MVEFGISILFQCLINILAKFNAFSRPCKLISQFNTFSILPIPRGSPAFWTNQNIFKHHVHQRMIVGNRGDCTDLIGEQHVLLDEMFLHDLVGLGADHEAHRFVKRVNLREKRRLFNSTHSTA